MAPLLNDLGTYLQTEGVGTLGSSIRLSRIPVGPTVPDQLLILRETAGAPPDVTLDELNGAIDQPGVQVRVRGAKTTGGYEAAKALADDAYKAFGRIHNLTLSGSRYVQCQLQQPPFHLDNDEANRPIFVFNLIALVERA